jgi:hypothetical protein
MQTRRQLNGLFVVVAQDLARCRIHQMEPATSETVDRCVGLIVQHFFGRKALNGSAGIRATVKKWCHCLPSLAATRAGAADRCPGAILVRRRSRVAASDITMAADSHFDPRQKRTRPRKSNGTGRRVVSVVSVGLGAVQPLRQLQHRKKIAWDIQRGSCPRSGGNFSNSAYLPAMSARLILLACAVCCVAVVAASCASAAVNVGENAGLRTARSPESNAETIVAQAWWDAAYQATTAQRQPPTRTAAPWIRNENRRYRRSSR